ncbi:MAG: recombinase family protein [Lachnospiraceae bacterium]|nr:recombinase family protein [Lachnospiraceae bacterium]
MSIIQKPNLTAKYLRISRDDGDKAESDSIGGQRNLIDDYIRQHKELKSCGEYVDDGFSGTNFDRPSFQRMIEDAKKKKINCIIVKDLSRLGRNYIETGKYMNQIFLLLGIRLIAITDHYDSMAESDDADQIIVPFKNLINDAYCRDISIKIRSQLDTKRKNGQFIGSFTTYGYRKDEKNRNHLVVDEYAAGIVRTIFQMKKEGVSQQHIADYLNGMGVLPPTEYKRSCGMNYNNGFRIGENPVWSAATVTRILRNEVYTGMVVQGKFRKINYKVHKLQEIGEDEWIRVPDMHEAVIPQETFDCVQELLERDTRTAPEEEAVNLFSGMLRCGDCGQNMVRRATKKNGKKYFYYHCSTYKRGDGCTSHIISEEKLKTAVLGAIRDQVELLVEAETILSAIGNLPEKRIGVKTLDNQLAQLHKEEERYLGLKAKLYQDMQEHVVSAEEYTQISQRFKKKIEDVRQSIAEVEAKRKRILSDARRTRPWIEEFKAFQNIESLDRSVLISLVRGITVYGKDSIKIEFRYEDEMMELLECATDEIPESDGISAAR